MQVIVYIIEKIILHIEMLAQMNNQGYGQNLGKNILLMNIELLLRLVDMH